MGEWSDTVYSSPQDPSSLISDNDRFVQYAVIMESEDPEVTPVLTSIALSWDPLGIEGAESVPALSFTSGNPSPGTLSVICSLPENQAGTLSLFDVSGRIIYQSEPGKLTGSATNVSIVNLQPGVYFARLDHTEGTVSSRVTVIR